MITRNDVAKLAGVSSATVSRVINNTGNVNVQLRNRVLEAITTLNYQPNQAAKSLRSQKKGLLGYIVPDIVNPYYTEIYKGIVKEATDVGYHCHLIEYNPKKHLLNEMNYDGIISSVWLKKEDFGQTDIPFIYEGIEFDSAKHYVSVRHNVEKPLLTLYQNQYNCGHRDFALITQQSEKNIRKKIYLNFLDEHNIPFDSHLVYEYSDASYQYNIGYLAMKSLLEKNKKITTVFAENDLIAIGAIKSIYEYGFRIPDDISIIGCDDTVAANYCIPPLTTVKRFKDQLGVMMAKMILDMIKGEKVENVGLEAQVILRETTTMKGRNHSCEKASHYS